MQREMRVPEWFTTIEIVKCFIICLYYLSSSLSLTPLLSTQPSPHLCDSLVALLSPCALIGRFKHFTRVTIIVARKSFTDSSRGWFHFISFHFLIYIPVNPREWGRLSCWPTTTRIRILLRLTLFVPSDFSFNATYLRSHFSSVTLLSVKHSLRALLCPGR